MRELKFRAWDGNKMFSFDNHKYDLIYNDISGWNIAPNTPNYTGKWLAGESASSSNDFILEQYTGLKDKNGLEIYEGDIVKTRTLSAELNELDFENYEVSFFYSAYCLFKNEQYVRQWKDGTHDWHSLENTESFEIEVIGNIHQNPELLK